jgi:glycosyltransferase involved in cell wall biosynthesis
MFNTTCTPALIEDIFVGPYTNSLYAPAELVAIIPCFNEYERLSVDEFSDFIQQCRDVRFCFVNDASTDRTIELLDKLKKKHPDRVLIVNLAKNGGKAEAVRHGVLYLKKYGLSGFVAFLDADLSAPLSELLRLFKIIKEERLLFTFGSRVATYGSNIQRNPFRHYVGRVFATLASMTLNMVVYDTQCGLKVFQSDVANLLFKKPFVSRWLFDVEIIMRLKMMYKSVNLFKIMKEVPIYNWVEKGNSKLRLYDMILTPFVLIRIRHHYRKAEPATEYNLLD